MSAVNDFYRYIHGREPMGLTTFTVWEMGEKALAEQSGYIRAMLMIDEQRMSPAEWRAHLANMSDTLGDDFTNRYLGIIPQRR